MQILSVVLSVFLVRLHAIFSEVEMKRLVLIALGVAVSSTASIYETISPEFAIDELIATEAVGWAVPLASVQSENAPEVWLATDLGNNRIEVGPWSDLARRSLVRMSLNANNQIVMQVLKPDTLLHELGGWPVLENANDWRISSVIEYEGRRLRVNPQEILIDFSKQDIEFQSLDFLHAIWAPNHVRSHNSRLLVSCSELEGRNRFTIMLGDVPIHIREVDELASEFTELKNSGWCPLNVVVDAERQSIGRSILEDNDVVLDGMNRRIVVVPKSEITPNSPLMKYRLDPSGSWRWIPSPGRVSAQDFLITTLDQISYRFRVLCLSRPCAQALVPSSGKLWVGRPAIEIDASGVIKVTDTKGWRGHQVELLPNRETVTIAIAKTGFRMKADPSKTIKGRRIEIVPAHGPREPNEFAIPHWPPVLTETVFVFHIRLGVMWRN